MKYVPVNIASAEIVINTNRIAPRQVRVGWGAQSDCIVYARVEHHIGTQVAVPFQINVVAVIVHNRLGLIECPPDICFLPESDKGVSSCHIQTWFASKRDLTWMSARGWLYREAWRAIERHTLRFSDLCSKSRTKRKNRCNLLCRDALCCP